MANLTIKDLPDEVYDELKVAARSEGRSLNGYIVALLKAIVDEANRRKLMREGRKEFRNFLGTLPVMKDNTPLIREDRDGRK
jgi:plasmid stability protein